MSMLQRVKRYLCEERRRRRAVGFDQWSNWTKPSLETPGFFEWEYQYTTRGWLILKRALKLLAPPLVTWVINANLPLSLRLFNNPVFWFWEVAAVALVVAPIGTGAYPRMRVSFKKHLRAFVAWVQGD